MQATHAYKSPNSQHSAIQLSPPPLINQSQMASPKHVHIEAIQSIMPGKIAAMGQSRKINLDGPLTNETLQSHLRIVLYYKKNGSDCHYNDRCSSVLALAAWAKETMSAALSEHPVLAGRLRRDREGDGYWEVKFNDAGVRMVQATAEMGMEEWLGMEGREGREGVLAYWMDVDREHPEMSALFYVQVTEFQADGYSIGFSCSLLLADPMFLIQFLKKWAISHNSFLAQTHPETPIFHLGYFTNTKRPNHLKSIPLSSIPTTNPTTTTLFKLDQASKLTQKLKAVPMSKFSLIVNKPSELKIESWKNEELVRSNSDNFDSGLVGCMDEYFGLDELALGEGNKPVSISCRVVSCEHEGMVVVMPSSSNDGGDSEVLVSITVPGKN